MIMTRDELLDLRCASLGDRKVDEAVRAVREFCGMLVGLERQREVFLHWRGYGELSTLATHQVFAWLSDVGRCDGCKDGEHTGCEPAVCDCECNDVVQLLQPLGSRSWAADGLRTSMSNVGGHFMPLNHSNHGNPGGSA